MGVLTATYFIIAFVSYPIFCFLFWLIGEHPCYVKAIWGATFWYFMFPILVVYILVIRHG